MESVETGELVQTAERLQRDARSARKAGHLDEAVRLLRQTIGLLVTAHEQFERQDRADPGRQPARGGAAAVASEPARRVADLLADSFGSLAGILRRQEQESEALDLYRKGKELEEDERFRLVSTYNRVQWLVLSVLVDPSTASTDGFREQVSRMLPIVERAARESDRDPWRYADLALLALLAGDHDAAFDTLEEMRSLNPVSDVYKSGLPVLQTLAAALPDEPALQEAATWYASQLGG